MKKLTDKKKENWCKKERNSIWIVMVIVLCGLIILLQSCVYLHFDDFGYGSLTYGWTGNAHGMDWTANDLISFLKWHYLNWGGRILFFAPLCILLRCGEWPVRIAQSCFLLGIPAMNFLICRQSPRHWKALFLSMAMLGTLGMKTMENGVLWHTAASLYVWPIPFLLFGCYCLLRADCSPGMTAVGCVAMFCAGFSQENTAILVLVFSLLLTGCQLIIKKKVERRKGVILIFGVLGAVIELTAPGNFVRAESNASFTGLSIWGKISITMPRLLWMVYSHDNWAFCIVLITILLLCSLYLKENSKKGSIQCRLLLPTGISSFLLLCTWSPFRLPSMMLYGIWLLFTLIFTSVSILFLVKTEPSGVLLSLLLGGIASLGAMLMAPPSEERVMLPFLFSIHVFSVFVFTKVPREGERKHLSRMGILLVMLTALINFSIIFCGYVHNAPVNFFNHFKLQEKSAEIQAGEEIDAIVLFRLPDDRFAPQMPYQESYITYWVRCYYRIPQTVPILWTYYGTSGLIHESIVIDPSIASIHPEEIDREAASTSGDNVTIHVVPEVMGPNMRIVVNGTPLTSTYDDSSYSARVPPDFLKDGDLVIQLEDIYSKIQSESAILPVR